jgi:hypothetical protein
VEFIRIDDAPAPSDNSNPNNLNWMMNHFSDSTTGEPGCSIDTYTTPDQKGCPEGSKFDNSPPFPLDITI